EMGKVLLGVGNPLARDDGVGVWIAEHLQAPGWTAIPAYRAPENVLGKIASLRPELLVVVDAAEMGLPPGEVRRLPVPAAREMLGTTHGLPLPFILRFLQDAAGEVFFLGIQPREVGIGEGLSPEVKEGALRILEALERGDLESIPLLGEGISRST
ncbi:MAG TPA: hydrogenase 3 maturation endopeptidase HyCI, partial [Candidatus Acetothermia bacterium]|nr:hydrogenase 3 maturation endopeptidase HyCI [Candidatus Acetothermia bacterium]